MWQRQACRRRSPAGLAASGTVRRMQMSTTHDEQTVAIMHLDGLELVDAWSKADPAEGVRFAFPISADTGARTLALAYAVLEPGGAIPWHTDSAEEEVILVHEGTIELAIDDGRRTVEAGSAVRLPAGRRHRVRNGGATRARTVHCFGRARDVVTFATLLLPMDRTVLGGTIRCPGGTDDTCRAGAARRAAKEAAMHAAIRTYRTEPGALDEVERRVREGFVPLLGGTPGFRGYYSIRAGDRQIVTVSLFDDQAGADRSVAAARDVVREQLAPLLPEPPAVSEGEVTIEVHAAPVHAGRAQPSAG